MKRLSFIISAVLTVSGLLFACDSADKQWQEGSLRDIRPEGWLLEKLESQKEGLTGHPEALSYPYNTCLWAGEIPRMGEHGRDWWRYEQTAYYTDGLLRLGYLLDDEEFILIGEAGIDYTLEHPWENGRLGSKLVDYSWPFAVFFRAMKARYDVAPDPAIFEALTRHYNSIPMDAFNTKEKTTLLATSSRATDYSINVSGFWNYTKMRSINNFIKLLDQALDKNIISQNDHDEMLGEAIFARAYCYFGMVRRYGGVPIVTEPLDDYYDGKENAGLYVPRSTEKETWDFVISELDRAIDLLPENRTDGKYRATKWSALGLQSRVALYAASVSKYWNREAIPSEYKAVKEKLAYMEASYANEYYRKCIEASEAIINSGKFSLYGGATADRAKAKENLTNLFLERQDCEFIFGKSYNTGVTTATHNFDINNSPNQAHGIMTSQGWGNMSLTVDLVDLYDDYDANGGRVDGTVKTRNDGNEYEFFSQIGIAASTFDPNIDFIKYDNPAEPFLNKDARFQAWVLYPGCSFRGVTIGAQAGFIKPDGTSSFYEDLLCDVGNVRYFALGGSSILSEGNTDPKFLSSNVSARR